MIITASRRTDIPAFYSSWLLARLEQGHVLVPNPFNKTQVTKLLFSPETVDCLVFFSKNPKPIMDKLKKMQKLGYNKYYFEFTLTPYGKDIEQHLPDKKELINMFHNLATKTYVVWRYDPVIITKSMNLDYHLASFAKLAKELSQSTDRCIFSFIDLYAKLKKLGLERPLAEQTHKLAQGMAQIAQTHSLKLFSCCEAEDFSSYGIIRSACVDKQIVESVAGYKINANRHKGQRKLCNCLESFDIGMYDSCANGCIYCYANQNPAIAKKNLLTHIPAQQMLIQKKDSWQNKEKNSASLRSLF